MVNPIRTQKLFPFQKERDFFLYHFAPWIQLVGIGLRSGVDTGIDFFLFTIDRGSTFWYCRSWFCPFLWVCNVHFFPSPPSHRRSFVWHFNCSFNVIYWSVHSHRWNHMFCHVFVPLWWIHEHKRNFHIDLFSPSRMQFLFFVVVLSSVLLRWNLSGQQMNTQNTTQKQTNITTSQNFFLFLSAIHDSARDAWMRAKTIFCIFIW